MCKEADKSTLIFFCDGAKEEAIVNDMQNIAEVRNVVKNFAWPGKKIIFESEKNKGLVFLHI